MLLAGDIGGTKTNIALYQTDRSDWQPIAETTYRSAEYDSLEEIVRDFMARILPWRPIRAAAFGVAGPVVEGTARITNLPWTISERSLMHMCGLPKVRLINDLVATANAVPILTDDDLFTLNEGRVISGGTIAVIAPGTGLGEAFLTWNGNDYQAYPSEGGHAAFSPSNKFELDLLRYLFEKYDGHVSTERVCSGSGIPNIYTYLRDTDYAPESAELATALASADDPTPLIVTNALSDTPDPLCAMTLKMFAEILGSETGDLGLSYLATGGVYLGGGIPPRILPVLQTAEFFDAFAKKGRFEGMMRQIPVKVILNSKAALLGAARAGYDLLT